MISFAVLIDVIIQHLFSGDFFDKSECLQDRDRVVATSAKVINFCNTRGLNEFVHESRDVERMNIVANLFTFITENFVGFALQIAADQVAEKSMQLDAYDSVRSGNHHAGSMSAFENSGHTLEPSGLRLLSRRQRWSAWNYLLKMFL